MNNNESTSTNCDKEIVIVRLVHVKGLSLVHVYCTEKCVYARNYRIAKKKQTNKKPNEVVYAENFKTNVKLKGEGENVHSL